VDDLAAVAIHNEESGVVDEVVKVVEPTLRIVGRPLVQPGLHPQYPCPGNIGTTTATSSCGASEDHLTKPARKDSEHPKNRELVANISRIRATVLRDLWQSEGEPPTSGQHWWELWLRATATDLRMAQSNGNVQLRHRFESVKYLPDKGSPPHDPASVRGCYGASSRRPRGRSDRTTSGVLHDDHPDGRPARRAVAVVGGARRPRRRYRRWRSDDLRERLEGIVGQHFGRRVSILDDLVEGSAAGAEAFRQRTDRGIDLGGAARLVGRRGTRIVEQPMRSRDASSAASSNSTPVAIRSSRADPLSP